MVVVIIYGITGQNSGYLAELSEKQFNKRTPFGVFLGFLFFFNMEKIV